MRCALFSGIGRLEIETWGLSNSCLFRLEMIFFPLRGLNEGGLDLLYFPNTLLVLIKNQCKSEVST